MAIFAEIIVNGVVIGLVYALMALGLAFVYNIMRAVNFAHGEFYVTAAYAYFWFSNQMKLPLWLAIPLALVVTVLVAWCIERVLLRPVAEGKVERPGDYALIITLALSIMLQKSFVLIFGAFSRQPITLVTGYVSFGAFQVTGERIAVAIGAILVIVGLFLFARYSWYGKMLMATAQNRFGAESIGVNVRKMTSVAFVLGGALAGAAGILLTPIFSVFPTAGVIPVVKGFVVIVLAGLGSIVGTIWTGLIVGLVEMLGSVFISSAYRDAYGFVLLLLVLVLRPQGLFGEKERLA